MTNSKKFKKAWKMAREGYKKFKKGTLHEYFVGALQIINKEEKEKAQRKAEKKEGKRKERIKKAFEEISQSLQTEAEVSFSNPIKISSKILVLSA